MRTSMRRIVAAGLALIALPVAAQADTVTFDWVPTGGDLNATGTLTFTVPSFTQAADTFAPYGTYYASSSYSDSTAALGALTAFTFSFGDGNTVNLSSSMLTTETFTAPGSPTGGDIWATSDASIPASTGYANALVTGLELDGHALGSSPALSSYFILSNQVGSVWAPGQGDTRVTELYGNQVNDIGYWELAPVPLPAGLPLLIGGLGLIGALRRRIASPGPSAA